MKMIIRIDDVGYSAVNDIGAFETIENGVATAADVMLEAPNTVAALERLRDYPWISVGWHTHFWCSPVLPAEQVPSLLIPGARRFRPDIQKADDIDREELLAECRAQMDRCIRVLGRVPDCCEAQNPNGSVFMSVRRQICDEYGIAAGFANRVDDPEKTPQYADDKWKDRKIHIMTPRIAYKEIYTDSITEQLNYDPVKYYTENRFHAEQFPKDAILSQSWHPGYLDYFTYRQGDNGPNARFFAAIRTEDVHALCSPELRSWIRESRVELMNFHDALYGTRHYQNHLRATGSDLYVG